MQMIADGKIKEGTKIKIVGRFANGVDKYFDFEKSSTFEIYYKEKGLYDVGKWTGHVTLYDLINYSFEILEYGMDDIEEFKVSENNLIKTETGTWVGRKMDVAFANKIN